MLGERVPPSASDAASGGDNSEALRPIEALSGQYDLMGRIGAGGMAELYVARLSGLGGFEKIVVLKRILAARATDPDFIRMFEDEARVAATLAHPNIVTTHDIGRDGDDVFFTMEYLHGETVRRVIAGAKRAGEAFPIELALQITIGCAAGLHYAHEHCDYRGRPLGIVHRDVSPSNVLVTYQSGVKLIDFGIAKAASGQHITEVGVVKGKAAYMSPEQCLSTAIDRRSDVFCLGIMLYEMLTAERPFAAEHVLALLAQIVKEDPEPPSRRRAGVPRGLDRIVMRALAKDPAERFQSAFEMQEALEMFTREHNLHALPGALGRYLEHLFGAKSEPWLPKGAKKVQPPPPPLPGISQSVVTTPRQRIDQGGTPPLPVVEPVAIAVATPSPTVSATEPMSNAMSMSASASAPETFATFGNATHASTSGLPVAAEDHAIAMPSRARWLWIGAVGAAAAVIVWAAISAASRDTPREPAAIEVAAASPTPAAAPSVVPPPVATPSAIVPSAPAEAPLVVVDEEAAPTTSSPSDAERKASRRATAQQLLAQAQDISYKDPRRAMTLAQRAIDAFPSQDGWSLLGVTACRAGDPKAARRAFDKLKGTRRDDLASVCSGRGIVLK
jgi:serine/threonine protein kinase